MSKWPFDSRFTLTSPFGMRLHPVYGVPRFHRGVDLVVAPANGPIHAFTPGEVLHAQMGVPGSGFGNYGIVVAIRDKYGFLHCYAHLSSAAVVPGQQVKQGQRIGNQGNTGVGTGAHLHYEIRKTSGPSYGYTPTEAGVVEPAQYLADYYAREPRPDEREEPEEEGVKVVVNDKLAGYGRVIDGHVYLPLRELGAALGKAVHWDHEAKKPYIDGKAVAAFRIADGMAFVGVRAAAELLGAVVSWHPGAEKVFVYL